MMDWLNQLYHRKRIRPGPWWIDYTNCITEWVTVQERESDQEHDGLIKQTVSQNGWQYKKENQTRTMMDWLYQLYHRMGDSTRKRIRPGPWWIDYTNCITEWLTVQERESDQDHDGLIIPTVSQNGWQYKKENQTRNIMDRLYQLYHRMGDSTRKRIRPGTLWIDYTNCITEWVTVQERESDQEHDGLIIPTVSQNGWQYKKENQTRSMMDILYQLYHRMGDSTRKRITPGAWWIDYTNCITEWVTVQERESDQEHDG